MLFSLRYLAYFFCRPTHSWKHSRLKRMSARYARDNALYEQAVAELSEYTKEPRQAIERRNKELTEAVRSRDYDALSEQELTRFYEQTRHYLYELPLWNAASARGFALSRILVPYLKKRKYKTVLEFGAGTAELCMELAARDFTVSYTDINPALIDFVRWRFAKRGLSVAIVPTEKLAGRSFDCIASFDVFEHLKGLPGKLGFFNSLLVPGGALVFNIELSGEGLHLKENKMYADERILDGALADAGFAFDWKFKQFFFYRKKSPSHGL